MQHKKETKFTQKLAQFTFYKQQAIIIEQVTDVHSGLKIRRPLGNGGSSPPSGTISKH
jgi:hypothetical protein